MTNTPPDEIKQAVEHLNAGRISDARQILTRFIQQNPTSEYGWYLMSFVVSDAGQQIDCLRRVLRLNPAHPQAQARMNKIKSSLYGIEPPPEKPSPPPVQAPIPGWSGEAAPPARAEDSRSKGNEAGLGAYVVPGWSDQKPAPATPPFVASSEEDAGAIPGFHPAPSEPVSPFRQPPPAGPDSAPPRPPAGSNPPPGDALAELRGTAAKSARQPGKEDPRNNRRGTWVAITIVSILVLLMLAGLTWAYIQFTTPPAASVDPGSSPTPVAGLAAFPTPSTVTPQPSPTPRATWTATPTATYMPLNPTLMAQMDTIQREVSDLRGLPIKTQVPSYIVSIGRAEDMLKAEVIDDDYLLALKNQQHALTALGMIKPTYDMVNLALNHLVDNIGGFYMNKTKDIFVIGIRFSGIEHFVYSHEFDHALVDQTFNFSKMEDPAVCGQDAQRCEAVNALIEGDATFLMNQWWKQYASPQDYRDIAFYTPPLLAVPDDFSPPFLEKEVAFTYDYGLKFVTYLYERGNWARVNQAYASPPASTEQILHPEKYITGEEPIPVADPVLATTLGDSWVPIESSTLGEFDTYLLLGYGADLNAQIADETAAAAAQGWGGDHYQVYYNASTDSTSLAAHWVWDSQGDADQFLKAMSTHLTELYRGNRIEEANASCWQVNSQTSCLFSAPRQTLWLVGPDLSTVEAMRAQFTDLK